MIGASRLVLFSLVSTVTYTFAFYFNWALFRFYPKTGEFEWLCPLRTDSASISWYGWIAVAALAGAVMAVLTPRRVLQRIPASTVWLVPTLSIAAIILYEKRWFA